MMTSYVTPNAAQLEYLRKLKEHYTNQPRPSSGEYLEHEALLQKIGPRISSRTAPTIPGMQRLQYTYGDLRPSYVRDKTDRRDVYTPEGYGIESIYDSAGTLVLGPAGVCIWRQWWNFWPRPGVVKALPFFGGRCPLFTPYEKSVVIVTHPSELG